LIGDTSIQKRFVNSEIVYKKYAKIM